jgi:type I restriction enzyme S subunit
LPEGWRVVPLTEITEKPKQVDPRRNPSMAFKYVDVSSVSRDTLTIVGWEEIKGAQAPSRARKLMKKEDIIIATVRPGLKRIAMVPDHLDGQVCSTGFCVIRCAREKADPTFVYFAVTSPQFVKSIAAHQKGSSYPAVADKQVMAEQIPFPPVVEQRRIAQVLSTIQGAIEAQDKVIAAARELKRSLMKHLFTYGPVPVTETSRVPLKETDIGPIPEHWELLDFGSLIAEGPQNGLYKPQSLYGGGTPIIRINDYENLGEIVTSAANRARLAEEEVTTFRLNRGDILINRVNSLSHLGKAALVGELREATVFESNMMRLAVNTARVIPEYAFRLLCTAAVREHFRAKSKRAVAQSSINQQDVKSLPFPLPPLAEQREVVRGLTAVEQKIAAEENRRASLQALFKSMLHHLMTGKIRVHEEN